MPREVAFYKGAIKTLQPEQGYRAGTDALLLAASVSARTGSNLLELGCGSGIVMLAVNHNQPGCELTGLDNNTDMLCLAKENANGHENIKIAGGSVADIPVAWHLQFDQVFSNPPFFDDIGSVRMSKAKAPSFVSDGTVLEDWIAKMLICLKPRGTGTIIYRADGLEKILASLFGKAGNIRVLPVQSYSNDPAKRVIVQFRKGVKSASALLPALIMHDHSSETRYTEHVEKILCGELTIDLTVNA